MSKRITELPLATQLNTEDQFIFYSNSAKETQRVNAGISLNAIASNLPGVLKATTNASLGIANAALADAKAAEALANAATAQASAEGAQTSANGKAKVYYQSSAPTGGVYNAGDIWYDTDDSYKLYVRTGGAWVASFGPMLKLDGNNNIFGLVKADGTDKSFVLVAENFQVWNGVSPEVPFEVVEDPSNPTNQVVRIKNAQIQTVDAGKITSGFLSSQVLELANLDAYLQSSSFIETWTNGRVFRQKSLGKAIPSDQLQCKVEQADGTFLVYDCLSSHTSSGGSFPGVGGLWALTDPQPSPQSTIGFRINGNGQAEFNGVKVRGNIIANTGYFGSGSDTIQIGADGGGGANGLTLGNKGYIKSTGLTYSGSNFTGSTSGFFLGNTQGYDQTSVYQFFIGNPSGNYLKWNGTDLTLKGNLIGGSTVGTSGEGTFGLTINSSIGLRYYDNNGVLTITGGTNNWINSGAGQLDLQGKDFGGANAGGAVQLIGGKGANGKVFLRTWNGDANNYYDCVTASTNGSVGINNSSPSSSYKLDVSGDGRFTGELISSNITASISTYTVGLWDGGNNIRFKYEDGLYAKIDASDPILIVSPTLNLAASEILGEFTFGSTNFAGAVKTGTIDWDANGNNVTGQGVAIYRKGIVGADGTKVTFVIDTSGNATFAGTLSAPNGNIGGFTIDGKLYIQKTTLTDANDGVYLATDGIALGASSVFKVTSAGALTAASATITGAITATSGFIGTAANGFSINSSYIAKGKVSLTDSNSGVYIGADGIALGASSVFKVTNTGVLTATSANITGAITATSGSFTGTVTATSGSFTGTITSTLGTIGGFTIGPTSLTAGTGSSAIGMATSGGYAFFAGNATPASAPFRVAPTGELTATSVTVTGSVTSTSGNIAGTTTVGNGTTTAVTIGNSINTSGVLVTDLINSKLDTSAKQIKDGFSFTSTGALNITGTGSANIKISPAGIVATNSSNNVTFTLNGTDGSATFGGNLSAPTGTIGGFTIGAAQLYTGSKSTFGSNNAGVYVGNDGIKLGSAFYVDTNGSLTASSITATGSITSTSGNIAGTTTVGNGSTTAVTVGGAINAAGNLVTNLINSKLDTSSSTILSSFSFEASGYAGALKAGDITWNTSGAITGGSGIVINAKGIIGAAAGVPTFSIDSTTGAATFGGTLSAPSGNIGGFTIGASQLYTGSKSTFGSSNAGVYVGTDGIALGANSLFNVTSAGVLTATSANITGAITATSGSFTGSITSTLGTIGGFNIDATRLYTSNISLDTSNKNLSISQGGTAILEVVGNRARFAAKNNGGAYTLIFQGDNGFDSSSFLDMYSGSDTVNPTISFYAASGYGYFSTFYDRNNSSYYCDPASTSNFNGLNVGGNAVVTAGASTNFGQLQVNDWLTFDNSQTRLSISDDFGNGNYLTYAGGTNGHRWVNSGNTVQLALLNNSGDLNVAGALSKGSGSFRIEHPLPSKAATHELVHSFIEGPRCALIYSGKINLVNGIAAINIDADSTMTEGTFEALCKNVHCFTTNETGWGAIRGKVVGNILTIEAQDLTSTDSVSWMVIGERKDKHIMDTDWTDENGRPIVEPLKK